jgi:hypothetical protein
MGTGIYEPQRGSRPARYGLVIGELQAMGPRLIFKQIKVGPDGVQFGFIEAALCSWRLAPSSGIAAVLVLAGLDAVWADIRTQTTGGHTAYMW